MSKVIAILKEIRPESDFDDSEDFLADGLLDSFDIVALVAALDREFNIAIDGLEIVPENFTNVEAIERLLERHGVKP